jgi:cytochrome c oxidase cbb3-type subunit I/II
MPPYPWLYEKEIDIESTVAKINAMTTLGVPYPAGYSQIANEDLMYQADDIAANLKEAGIDVASNKEIIALIAYLQRLGTDISSKE